MSKLGGCVRAVLIVVGALALLLVLFVAVMSQMPDQVISAETETLEPWPFTVDEVSLRCRRASDRGYGVVTATTLDSREFALNGTAAALYPRIDPIWAENPDIPTTRISISDAISRALELCLADGRTAPPVRVRRTGA